MSKKKSLGRSMDALFDNQGKLPQTVRNTNYNAGESIRPISTDQLIPSSHQPRTHFDDEKIASLADSIKSQGVIQPIVVVKEDDENMFKIIAGERRWRAAKLAGVKKVPAIVRDFKGAQGSVVALIENIQREDLNPLERARALSTLCNKHSMKQQELAGQLGVSRTYLTNTLRLLKLSESTQAALERELISEGHAKILCGLSISEQDKVLKSIISKGLTVRDLESYLRPQDKEDKGKSLAIKKENKNLKPVIDFFEEFFSMRVDIQSINAQKGKVVFHYNNLEELDGMIDKLGVDVENRF